MNKILLIVVVIIVVFAFALFRRRPKRANPRAGAGSVPNWPPNLDPERIKTMSQRPHSLSFVAFTEKVLLGIPRLLGDCKYVVITSTQVQDTPAKLYVSCEGPRGPNNAIAYKAAFEAAGHTFLLEPEMILAATNQDQLIRFAKQFNCRIIAASWERVSESAMLLVFTGDGLQSQTWYCEGKPEGEQINPHPTLANSPDHQGLIAAIRQLGVPMDVLANAVRPTMYQLQE